jgi:excisionase family DNA binding protein
MSSTTRDGFATRDQIAHELGITTRTLQRWQNEEGLPVIRVGRICRYSRESVAAWFLSREQRCTPSAEPR